MSYEVHILEHANGAKYKALGPEDAINAGPPDSSGVAIAELVGAWVYATGSSPALRRQGLVIAIAGSRAVMHEIQDGGIVQRIRVILLSNSQATVTFDGVSDSRVLQTQDTYVDTWLTSGGEFDHFGNISAFDRNSTEGSTGLMDEIDAAREEHGVE